MPDQWPLDSLLKYCRRRWLGETGSADFYLANTEIQAAARNRSYERAYTSWMTSSMPFAYRRGPGDGAQTCALIRSGEI